MVSLASPYAPSKEPEPPDGHITKLSLVAKGTQRNFMQKGVVALVGRACNL